MIEILLTEDATRAIEKYTLLTIENARAGNIDHKRWEESRSYAVEALTSLLVSNPKVFRYKNDIEKAIHKDRS